MIISFVSASGGTGKTTSAANIGISLAKSGKKTVVVDANTGFRSLDIALGLESAFTYDISDIFFGNLKTDDVLVECNDKNLFLLPAALSGNQGDFNENTFKEIVSDLNSDFDCVLIDCPSGIDETVKCAVSLSDTMIVCTLPNISSIRQTERFIELSDSFSEAECKILINKIYPEFTKSKKMMSADDVLDKLGRTLIGIIPYDAEIMLSFDNAPIAQSSTSTISQAYLNISKRILGENVPITDFAHKKPLWKAAFNNH